MYDFLIDVANNIVKHGLSVTTLLGAVFIFLKNPRVKAIIRRIIKRFLKNIYPFLFSAESEVKSYIENQKIIMENQKRIMERMGIEWHATTLKIDSKSSVMKKEKSWRLLLIMSSIVQSVGKHMKSGGMKMKNYLRKLGSRKFQSLLLSLIINAVSAYLFFSGVVEIDAVLDAYMPMINLIVGTISTWIYIFIEGKIDAANVPPSLSNQDQGVDYTQDTGV